MQVIARECLRKRQVFPSEEECLMYLIVSKPSAALGESISENHAGTNRSNPRVSSNHFVPIAGIYVPIMTSPKRLAISCWCSDIASEQHTTFPRPCSSIAVNITRHRSIDIHGTLFPELGENRMLETLIWTGFQH